jgi:hypothetical protein
VLTLDMRWMCSHCWRVSYPSEYLGRCPEAAPARIEALLASARRARSPAVRKRREERAAQAQALRDAHEARLQVAGLCRDLAQAVRMTRWVARHR